MVTASGAISNIPNPFNLHPRTQSTEGSASSAFDRQLVDALGESLRRIGVPAGEVNITIRNTGGASDAGRQILITYNAAATISQPAASRESAASGVETNSLSTTGAAAETGVRETAWSPWDGPKDRRDEIPAGGGRVSATGAPVITPNGQPAKNQHNYAGPAAFNPYFTTPSNPLRADYVLGYQNWFRDSTIYGGIYGPVPANRAYFTTEEGAQEALRLVREYEPGAELTQRSWGGGPFSASNSMYYIQLSGDRMVNAGLVLNGYYNGGQGVTPSSDELLASELRQV